MRSMDFAIGGGWHVSLFGPWVWAAAGVIVLVAAVRVAKLFFAR